MDERSWSGCFPRSQNFSFIDDGSFEKLGNTTARDF
jgi:hypothetical protein